MKKFKNIFILAAGLIFSMASCSQEAPFSIENEKEEGKILTSTLSIDVKSEEIAVRAESVVPSPKDFSIEFYNTTDLESVVKKYDKFSSMPEVVSLPVGNYIIKAVYGGEYGSNGETAGFDKPHYVGVSETFSIESEKITPAPKTIVCKLANVRVSVIFDQSLRSVMSSNSKVTVKIGNSNALDFYPSQNENDLSNGYFKINDGNAMLNATFIGKVNGENIEETKTYDKIKEGLYYKLTFRLHTFDPNDPGDIVPDENGGLNIDASVFYGEYEDNSADPGNGNYVEDDMRPQEGAGQGSEEDPGQENPGDDVVIDPSLPGPEITASEGVDLEGINDVNGLNTCVLYVHCDQGIKEFIVDIDSPDLVKDLQGMSGWSSDASHLDLINPQDKKDFLTGLLNREVGECLIGEKDMDFDITMFLTMLGSFKGVHKFNVTVKDLNNKTSKASLQLEIK